MARQPALVPPANGDTVDLRTIEPHRKMWELALMGTRIALVNHSFAPLGGREIHAAMLANGFQELGAKVDLWACRIDAEFAARFGVPCKAVGVPFRGMLRPMAFSSRVAALRLRDRYDYIVSMSPMVRQHVHISGGARDPETDRSIKARMLRAHHDWTVDAAPVVVASTASAAKVLSRRLPSVPKVVSLYPPIDTSRFYKRSTSARAAARAAFGFSANKKYLLFPSTGHARKGFDVAASAVTELASMGVQLVVAGKPVDTPNVVSLGFVDDMARLYSAVDCTILPTRDDPFGLVVAESIRCGTPVITSIFAGAAEIVSPDDGIVVSEISTSAVKLAIEQFLSRTWSPDPMSDLDFLSPANYAAAVYDLARS